MKRTILCAVLFVGSLLVFSGEKTEVKFISLDEFQKLIKANDGLIIVDVLGPESYARSHIKSAVNIPLARLGEEKNIRMLRSYKTIVVYCAHSKCTASVKAAELLIRMGFTNVLDFKGGIKEWTESGLPVESSPTD